MYGDGKEKDDPGEKVADPREKTTDPPGTAGQPEGSMAGGGAAMNGAHSESFDSGAQGDQPDGGTAKRVDVVGAGNETGDNDIIEKDEDVLMASDDRSTQSSSQSPSRVNLQAEPEALPVESRLFGKLSPSQAGYEADSDSDTDTERREESVGRQSPNGGIVDGENDGHSLDLVSSKSTGSIAARLGGKDSTPLTSQASTSTSTKTVRPSSAPAEECIDLTEDNSNAGPDTSSQVLTRDVHQSTRRDPPGVFLTGALGGGDGLPQQVVSSSVAAGIPQLSAASSAFKTQGSVSGSLGMPGSASALSLKYANLSQQLQAGVAQAKYALPSQALNPAPASGAMLQKAQQASLQFQYQRQQAQSAAARAFSKEPTNPDAHGNYINGVVGYRFAPDKPAEYRPGGAASRSGWKGPTAAPEDVKDGSSHLTPFARVTYGVGLDEVRSIVYGQLMEMVDANLMLTDEVQRKYSETQRNSLRQQLNDIGTRHQGFAFPYDKKCGAVYTVSNQDPCDFSTESAIVLQQHRDKLHLDNGARFQCARCPMWTRKSKELFDHMKGAHKAPIQRQEPAVPAINCNLCSFGESNSGRFQAHTRKCGDSFKIGSNLRPFEADYNVSIRSMWVAPAPATHTIIVTNAPKPSGSSKPSAPIMGGGVVVNSSRPASAGASQQLARASLHATMASGSTSATSVASAAAAGSSGSASNGKLAVKGHTVVYEGLTYVCDGTIADTGNPVYVRQTTMMSPSALVPRTRAIAAPKRNQVNVVTVTTNGGKGAGATSLLPKTAAHVEVQSLAKVQLPKLNSTTAATNTGRSQPSAQETAGGSGAQDSATRPKRGRYETNATKPLSRNNERIQGVYPKFYICELCGGFLCHLDSLKLHAKHCHSVEFPSKPAHSCKDCGLQFYTLNGCQRHSTTKCNKLTPSSHFCFLCAAPVAISLVEHVINDHSDDMRVMITAKKCNGILCTKNNNQKPLEFATLALFVEHVYAQHRLQIQGIAAAVEAEEAEAAKAESEGRQRRPPQPIRFQPYCAWCKKRYADAAEFKRHCAEYHMATCSLCGVKCHSEPDFIRHLNVHNRQFSSSPNETCSICKAVVKKRDMLYHYHTKHRVGRATVQVEKLPSSVPKPVQLNVGNFVVGQIQVIEDDMTGEDVDVVHVLSDSDEAGVEDGERSVARVHKVAAKRTSDNFYTKKNDSICEDGDMTVHRDEKMESVGGSGNEVSSKNGGSNRQVTGEDISQVHEVLGSLVNKASEKAEDGPATVSDDGADDGSDDDVYIVGESRVDENEVSEINRELTRDDEEDVEMAEDYAAEERPGSGESAEAADKENQDPHSSVHSTSNEGVVNSDDGVVMEESTERHGESRQQGDSEGVEAEATVIGSSKDEQAEGPSVREVLSGDGTAEQSVDRSAEQSVEESAEQSGGLNVGADDLDRAHGEGRNDEKACDIDSNGGEACANDNDDGEACDNDNSDGKACDIDNSDGKACNIKNDDGKPCANDNSDGEACDIDNSDGKACNIENNDGEACDNDNSDGEACDNDSNDERDNMEPAADTGETRISLGACMDIAQAGEEGHNRADGGGLKSNKGGDGSNCGNVESEEGVDNEGGSGDASCGGSLTGNASVGERVVNGDNEGRSIALVGKHREGEAAGGDVNQ